MKMDIFTNEECVNETAQRQSNRAMLVEKM